ncbi:MAG: flagellar assembly protein FliH [Pseudomonadota bacterium]|nr:flagellar assembly protein FliH [Pseudomonadota bacterium]
MSKIIRGEALSDCQAWHVPEVQSEGVQQRRPMTARQLEEIQIQAHREGFQQGVQEGRDAGLKEVRQRIQYLEQLIQSLSKPFEELDETVEQQLAQLAMLVARQLVRRELKTDPEQVIGVVREALSALPVTARNIRLALHPEDAVMIRECLSLEEDEQNIKTAPQDALGSPPGGIHLVDDPVQSRGGCRVFTEISQIDASVESRLNAVIASVLGGQRSTDSPAS